MEIKYSKDTRKHPKWEPVLSIDFMLLYWATGENKPVIRTYKFGYILLEDCTVRNANLNTSPMGTSE